VTSGYLDKLLFEYDNETHADLKDLGKIISQSASDKVTGADQIVRLNNQRWVYITGNGVDSDTGKAVLYMFYLNGNGKPNVSDKWVRIPVTDTTTASFIDPVSVNNGLSVPRPVDIDGDGNVDLVYAGDIQGNLWRFDINDLSAIKVSKVFKTANKQPIYTAPLASRLPKADKLCSKTNKAYCWMVSFGTGELMNGLGESTDRTNKERQALYGVYDAADGVLVNSSQLVEQTINAGTAGGSRTLTNNAVVFGPTLTDVRGWKLTLSDGERISTNPLLRSSTKALFATARPKGKSQTACFPSDGWLTEVDLNSGATNASGSIGEAQYGNLDVLSGLVFKRDLGGTGGAAGVGNSGCPLGQDVVGTVCTPPVCPSGQSCSGGSTTTAGGTAGGLMPPQCLSPKAINSKTGECLICDATKNKIVNGVCTPNCPVAGTCPPTETVSGRVSWREVFGLPR
jgi:Tfp pilus tip-associated adhesin PilY1